jgi:hypothetical protein
VRRRSTAPPRLLAAVLGLLLVLAGCSDDDDEAPEDDAVSSVPAPTTPEPDACGLDIPELPGTTPAPLCSLGVGIAIPQGWQATVLTPDALSRLEEASLARPSFLDAAQSVASTGAVFYAAGVADDETVSELKVDVQDDAATDPAAVRAVAQSVVDSGQVDDATLVEEPQLGGVRVDYRVRLPSAETGEPIDSYGSQLFVPDGDRLWSFIVTSEDEDTQTALLTVFTSSITFD